MRRLRPHLTYANVTVTLLAFIVLASGGAYAANTVFSSDIVDGEVKAADIATGAVSTAELANDGVRSVDIRDDALAGGGLSGADIDESSLTGSARKLTYQASAGETRRTLARVGPFTLKAECLDLGTSTTDLQLFVRASGGTASAVFDKIADDANFLGAESTGSRTTTSAWPGRPRCARAQRWSRSTSTPSPTAALRRTACSTGPLPRARRLRPGGGGRPARPASEGHRCARDLGTASRALRRTPQSRQMRSADAPVP
jgi:hypothetical protein